jgi:predicted MFS family arabinose efflux permease
VFGATTCLGLILLVGSLVTGRLADRFSLSRTFVWTRLAVTPTVFLMLVYSGPGLRTFLFVLVVGGIVLVANLTLYNLAATALMPQHCRATGMGLGYGVGVALFGGTAPYLLVWMQSRDVLWLFPSLTAGLSILSVALFALARRYSGQFAGR